MQFKNFILFFVLLIALLSSIRLTEASYSPRIFWQNGDGSEIHTEKSSARLEIESILNLGRVSEPYVCDSDGAGGLYYNSFTAHNYCDGSNWISFKDMPEYPLLAGRSGDVLKIDNITEYTADNGVTIEGTTLLDSWIDMSLIASAPTGDPEAGHKWHYCLTDGDCYIESSDGSTITIGEGGGGTGSPSTLQYVVSDSKDVSELITGNNAAFNGGGTLVGTITKDTSTILRTGAQSSYLWEADGSDASSDYFGVTRTDLTTIDKVKPKYFQAYYQTANIADDELSYNVAFYTSGDALIGTIQSLDLEAATDGKLARISAYIPDNASYALHGFYNTSTSTDATVNFDKLVVDDASGDITLYNSTEPVEYTMEVGAETSYGVTGTAPTKYTSPKTDKATWYRDGKYMVIDYTYIQETAGVAGVGYYTFSLPDGYEIDTDLVELHTDMTATYSGGYGSLVGYGTIASTRAGATSYYQLQSKVFATGTTKLSLLSVPNSSHLQSYPFSSSFSMGFRTPLFLKFHAKVPIKGWSTTTDATVTANEFTGESLILQGGNGFGSTDTRIRRFANEITNTTGSLISVVDTASNGLTVTALKDTMIDASWSDYATANAYIGFSVNSSQLATDVILITATDRRSLTYLLGATTQTTSFNGLLKAGEVLRMHGHSAISPSSSNAHLTITARPAASALNVITPTQRVAYIEDVKASGTAGGGGAATTYLLRDLNTLSGDTSFVSLDSNVFTLQPGTYDIEVSAPAHSCDLHRAKLVSNPLGSPVDIKFGSSAKAINTYGGFSYSNINTEVSITTPTDFAVYHWKQNTVSTSDFGAAVNDSSNEIYTQVKITKVK